MKSIRPGYFLLLLPPAVALAWGAYLPEQAYRVLYDGRRVAFGAGLTDTAALESLRAPLYVLWLAIWARLGFPLPAVALVTSALGWGSLAWVFVRLGRSFKRPVAGWLTALFALINPLVVDTLGTETAWLLVWAWLSMAQIIAPPRRATAGDAAAFGSQLRPALCLFLLLLTHFSLETVALALVLLGWAWLYAQRPPWGYLVAIVLAAALAGWWSGWQFGRLLSLNPAAVGAFVAARWQASQLYGVLLLGIGGLWLAWREGQRPFAIVLGTWMGAAALAGNPVTLEVGALFLLVLAASALVEQLEAQRSGAPTAVLAALTLIPLVGALAGGWQRAYWQRSPAEAELQQAAAAWIAADGPQPGASLLAGARVHFLSALPPGGRPAQAVTLAWLQAHPADYVVASPLSPWHALTRTAWFRHMYTPLQTFASAHTAASPYTVWGYRDSAFLPGGRELLAVDSPAGVGLVGYAVPARQIRPSERLDVTLFLQKRQAGLAPFEVVVGLHALDGEPVAQTRGRVETAARPLGRVLSETLTVDVPAGVTPGSYALTVALRPAGSLDAWPLFKANATEGHEAVAIGNVSVPWLEGLGRATAVEATFGESIALAAYEIMSTWRPNAPVDVTLYWETTQLPRQEYHVFLHLLDEAGELVVNHNRLPTAGAFPMTLWHPGGLIRDRHTLTLPAELPAGRYTLNVGLFDLETGERLEIVDADGREVPEGSLTLQQFTLQ